MELNDYHKRAIETAIYPKQHTVEGLVYSVLALCGETGELANKLKKHLRAGTPPNTHVLRDELGDVLWYVSSIANELGFSLESVAEYNLEKLKARKEKGELDVHK